MTNRQSDNVRAAIWVQRWLFLFYLLFVIYGSLVPLDYQVRPFDEAWAVLLGLRDKPLDFESRTDWATNLMLFVPLTFLAGQSFASRADGLGRIVIGVLLAVAASALAIAIEFLQIYFPARTPSQNDIVALSISGVVGVIAHWLFGLRVTVWTAGYWQSQQQTEKISRLLKGYLFVLFAFSVLPLDLTISPAEIYHKWSSGRVILLPFGALKGGVADMLYQVFTDVLIWVPAGVLWALRPGHGMARVVRKGVIAALVIECLQLFVYSRTTDITTVILAGVGCAIGCALLGRGQQHAPGLSRMSSGKWLAWWLAWVVLVLAVFWFPFGFDTGLFSTSAALKALTRTPLSNYYANTEFLAVNELLRKVGFFIPGGLLLGMAFRPRQGVIRRRWGPVSMLVTVAFLVEAGQLLLPEKVSDITDVLLESFGGLLGYAIAGWFGRSATPLPQRANFPASSSRSSSASPSSPAPLTGPAGIGGAAPLLPTRASAPPGPQPLRRQPETTTTVTAPLKPPAGYKAHLAWCVATAIVLGILVRLPFMPYNVRELIEPGAMGVVSVIGLALALHWIANGPFLVLTPGRRNYLLALPLTLIGHGLVTWLLLRIAVPLESIYDIAGSPVLDWPWEFELMGRYLALHTALMLQVVGAVLLVRALLRITTLSDVVYWLMVSLVLAWPLYTLNVSWADTDNLVELMGDHASFTSASAMAAGFLMTCLCGSAFAAATLARGHRLRLLVLSLIGAVMGTALFYAGAEHVLVKYGRAFSAFQFLLSSDREHYAHGMALALRYIGAYAAVTLGLAALQWMAWRDWLRQDQAAAFARAQRRSRGLASTMPAPLA